MKVIEIQRVPQVVCTSCLIEVDHVILLDTSVSLKPSFFISPAHNVLKRPKKSPFMGRTLLYSASLSGHSLQAAVTSTVFFVYNILPALPMNDDSEWQSSKQCKKGQFISGAAGLPFSSCMNVPTNNTTLPFFSLY